MKSARNTLPTEPVNDITCGIDWARDDHAVSIVDAKGREVTRKTIGHNWPDCGICSARSTLPAPARSLSNAPTAPWWTPCSTPESPWWSSAPTRSRTCAAATDRPATRTTGRRVVLADTCAPTAPGCTRCCPTPRGPSRCAKPAAPARTSSPTASRSQPAAGAPEDRPRRRRLVRRDRLADQPGVPGPLQLPATGRLAVDHPPDRVAGQRRLQRPHRSRELHRRLTSAARAT